MPSRCSLMVRIVYRRIRLGRHDFNSRTIIIKRYANQPTYLMDFFFLPLDSIFYDLQPRCGIVGLTNKLRIIFEEKKKKNPDVLFDFRVTGNVARVEC